MATLVHFDLSVDDPERAEKFYKEVFDWKFEKASPNIDYYFISTEDLKGQVGIGGGMSKRERPGQNITNYIGVASINETIDNLVKHGGRVIETKQAVPGWGFLAICTDTENNVFGLWEDEKLKR